MSVQVTHISIASTTRIIPSHQDPMIILKDIAIGRLLSHTNVTLAPQARQARVSDENLNYMTLASQARRSRPSGFGTTL